MSERRNIVACRAAVRAYYRAHGRHDLPWRRTSDPYRIVVSELMLQQTQVSRVIEKYKAFLQQFPAVRALAKAPLSDVLAAWSGLGYNRRAKFLHAAARDVVANHRGKFPTTVEGLEALPGIGPYTARAVAAFAYNMPVVLIETNVRTVFIHHFFPNKARVSDKELLPIIEAALDTKHPKEWYWALMDYGAHLKQTGNKVHRKSAQYNKQSPLAGSRREVRGAIVRTLVAGARTAPALAKETAIVLSRIQEALPHLLAEGMIVKKGARFMLAQD